ncbi:hypothetical protein [Paraburkholderia acidisoli]|uniref:Uncharacterized protein n=1 Tax=Paraburkholderia acidisoli TaxID=2571748 RepID=A0A7Z2JJL5_9BURK|nr:hypothetical protein [Paraburkholderia acidisoli]QGZ66383.1 hypothetical protein FAZ98_31860 [Paraburkholderia acidisoli]
MNPTVAVDIRTRLYRKERLHFVAEIPGYVVCKKPRHTPFVMRQSDWAKLPVFKRRSKTSLNLPHKPENVEAISVALRESKQATTSLLVIKTGLSQVTIDHVLECFHQNKKVYICDYDIGKNGGSRTRIWAFGNKPDASYPEPESPEVRSEKMKLHRARYEEKRGKKAATKSSTPNRDPLTAALFGARVADEKSLATLPSRIYQQSMDVDDLKEAA